MTADTEYVPPEVWSWNREGAGRLSAINRPTAGATHDKALPVGEHPLQLYSLGTPNGVKVAVMLEELIEAKLPVEYDAWLISIRDGAQFGSGFVEINPNSKIPALLDRSTTPPTRVFESGAILLYLAEKYGAFLPDDVRAECLSWLFWNIGSAPFLGGGFGHFYAYAPAKLEYPIDRYAMEVKRQLDVLDRRLAEKQFLTGDRYTIADMANYAWYGALVLHNLYDSATFLSVDIYENVIRWAKQIEERPAVKRGMRVNRPWGRKETRVIERHSRSDFDIAAAKED